MVGTSKAARLRVGDDVSGQCNTHTIACGRSQGVLERDKLYAHDDNGHRGKDKGDYQVDH